VFFLFFLFLSFYFSFFLTHRQLVGEQAAELCARSRLDTVVVKERKVALAAEARVQEGAEGARGTRVCVHARQSAFPDGHKQIALF
jgi:hypothetical protein